MKISSKVWQFFFYGILTLPILFLSFTMFPWVFGKTILFQIIIEILAILFLFDAIQKKKILFKKFNLLDYTVYGFFLILILTSLTGENFFHSLWGNQARSLGVFTWIHLGAFYFFLTQFTSEETQWKKLFQWSVIVAVFIGLSATFQNFLPSDWSGDPGGSRYSGLLGNPAFFASYVVVNAGFAWYLFSQAKEKKRYFFLLAGIFLSSCVFLSGTRGAFLGFVLGAFFSLALWFILSGKDKKTLKVRGGILSVFILLVSIFSILGQTSLRASFPAPIARLLDFSLTNGTGETRLMAWKIAWQGFKEKPLLGWGYGNYDLVFNKYYNTNFLKYSFQETVWDKPHNSFLEMLVSSGIFGFVYITVFVFSLYLLLRGVTKLSQNEKMGRFILAGTVVGYGIQVFFLFDTISVLIPVMVILAFSSFCWKLEKEKQEKNLLSVQKIFAMVGIFICLFSIYYYNIINFLESSSLKGALGTSDTYSFGTKALVALQKEGKFRDETAILLAEKFTQFEKAEAFSPENFHYVESSALATAETLENLFVRYPTNVAYATWSAQVYMILGQMKDRQYYQKAESLLQKAIQISPQKQETLFLLGRTYLLQKKFDSALDVQKKAIEVNPKIGISHWFYGLAQVASGKISEGLVSIEEALKTGYGIGLGERLYVIDLYASQKNYTKVIEQYKALSDGDPQNVNWYIKLATAYALAGDKKSALETVDKAVQISPDIRNDAEHFIKQYNLR